MLSEGTRLQSKDIGLYCSHHSQQREQVCTGLLASPYKTYGGDTWGSDGCLQMQWVVLQENSGLWELPCQSQQ